MWWVLTAADAAVVLVLSVIPIQVQGPSLPFLDKAVHLCEYFLLAWLLTQAMRATARTPRSLAIQAWVIASGYGALIEGIQALIPWRSAEVADALANACGAALGVWASQLLRSQSTVHGPQQMHKIN